MLPIPVCRSVHPYRQKDTPSIRYTYHYTLIYSQSHTFCLCTGGTSYCQMSSDANWMKCQTDWEPIRAFHAQPMAAADTETWASRSSHCCEVDKKLWKKTFLLINILHWWWQRRWRGRWELLHVTLGFFFQINLSAWSFVPGCILVFNNDSNKNNINNINCSINVVLVMYSVCF